ncbi:MAG: gluconeogenesis factor YvcK family protein, partial [Janthinobacterium lividum]
ATQEFDRSLRVVAIGGGTGLSTLLRGLKRFVATPSGSQPLSDSHCKDPRVTACLIRDLSAVVTVTDDGGSSGRLREDFKMLPPGDVRNCMVALSEDEHLLSRLFQFRFESGELGGHSFGNLFVAALSHITGDFAQAVQMSSQILATRGRIFPATNVDVTLSARMDDGSTVDGETSITASSRRIVELFLRPANATPLPETLEAIASADLITLGPGSLYTSLITNLLVQGIPEALAASRATRVYIGNLMTQANESIGLSAAQHIEKIIQHAGGHRIFDFALINTEPISPQLLQKYASEGQQPIEADLDRIRALGVEPITGQFVHEGDVLRHDYDRVTELLLNLALYRSSR